MSVYPFIEAEKQHGHIDQDGHVSTAPGSTVPLRGNVKRACELLKVSRSAYYQHEQVQAAGGSLSRQQDDALIEKISQVHHDSTGTYGAPRIHAELAGQGLQHGRKRIARLMRAAGLVGRARKQWRTTTIADPGAPARPDLIGRDFTPDPARIGSRFCGDITYIRTWEGWAYLATVIDLDSRKVVGWALGEHMRTSLVEDALHQAALTGSGPRAGAVFHSDRGCQYTSADFARTAATLGFRLSVGRKGQCWDNAVAESFFATIKNELIDPRPWATRTTLRTAVFDYINGWYNTRRRHSSLDYLSPAQYEKRHAPADQDQATASVA